MAKISQSKMAKLFQRLATSYKAGIDLRSAVKRESEIGAPAFKQRMKTVVAGLNGGGSLAEALAATGGYFPELVVSVVRAGEIGGRLEDSFARLGKHYNDLVNFRSNFLRAIAWPAFELVFAVTIVGVLMALCDWIFTSLEQQPFDWFWMGSTLGNVVAYYVIAVLIATTGILGVVGIARGWFGTAPLALAMKIPLVGGTIRCLALSRFAWTMSVAENAGMNALDIAELSLNSTENVYYTQFKQQVKTSLRSGRQFYPTFRDTEAFPEDLLVQIDNGETAGQLAESMQLISEDYQRRAEHNLEAIGKIGFVLMLMLVAGLVGAVVIFAASQYLNIINGLARPNAF